jgi:pyrroline-5-carboxylate reductase
MKLGLIGGGAMGEAIVAAVTRARVADAADVRVYEIVPARLEYLAKTYGIQPAGTPVDACAGAAAVLIALKPQEFDKAAPSFGPSLGDATAISIMAGITLSQLSKGLGTQNVVRAMPNTPAQIGEGMTGWTALPAVGEAGRAAARAVFGSMGKEAYVPEEKYLDMVTALSGSGPAYVFLFIEALIDAGVHVGLARDLATTMALQTVLGSARYMEHAARHPAELKNQVTSPAGTTAEALRQLEGHGLRAAVLEAVIAAYERSKALGEAAK